MAKWNQRRQNSFPEDSLIVRISLEEPYPLICGESNVFPNHCNVSNGIHIHLSLETTLSIIPPDKVPQLQRTAVEQGEEMESVKRARAW
jgi:hypothetical protein